MNEFMKIDNDRFRYYRIRLYGSLDVQKITGESFNDYIECSLDCRILSSEGRWLIFVCRVPYKVGHEQKIRYVDMLLCRKEKGKEGVLGYGSNEEHAMRF